jgi:hypothetical protein
LNCEEYSITLVAQEICWAVTWETKQKHSEKIAKDFIS